MWKPKWPWQERDRPIERILTTDEHGEGPWALWPDIPRLPDAAETTTQPKAPAAETAATEAGFGADTDGLDLQQADGDGWP